MRPRREHQARTSLSQNPRPDLARSRVTFPLTLPQHPTTKDEAECECACACVYFAKSGNHVKE